MLDNSFDINDILKKYEVDFLKNLNNENINKIIKYLYNQKVDYIEELLTDYLDIFSIDYEEFKIRFEKLKSKYGENLVEKISSDMNILEEL